ncbi:MAG: hypothetical protein FWG89_00575 [Treponema sp.]|nr:hypothetical protein [Treponema sp.]
MDKVVTYAFLSVIKEKSGNITSLLSIFEELIEGLLSTWISKKIKGGNISDLQKDFKLTYSIDIPIPTIKTIINNIIQKNNTLITKYEDDSFTINESPEVNFELILKKEQDIIEAFYELYNRYLQISGLKLDDYDLLLFFEQNKRYIISCLTATVSTQIIEEKYQVQAKFIKRLLHHNKYKELIYKIFLGSIISSYIELEIDDSTKHSKILLLDTSFVVSLLDLDSEESYENCKMLVEIANQLRYKVEIMPYTIDETKALLNRIASKLNSVTLFQSLNKDSIFYGCSRRNINASGLMFIVNKFEEMLRENYGILITDEMINNSMISEARQSDLYKQQLDRKHNPGGALHDATILYYTRKLRKGTPISFNDVNVWFVTNKPSIKDIFNISYHNCPLSIRAEELLHIMWLSHPSYSADNYIKTTISRLLSTTLNVVPDEKMLKALDKKIQVINDYPISAKDCIQIAETIGSIDNQKLKLLLEKNTQTGIINELKNLSLIAEEKEKIKIKEEEDFFFLLKEDMQKSIERERSIIKKMKDIEIKEITIEAKNDAINREIILIEEIIKRDCDELMSINNNIISQIPIKSNKYVKKLFIFIGILSLVVLCFLSYIIYQNWEFSQPFLYLLSMIPIFLPYFLGIFRSKKLTISGIKKFIKNKKENKLKKENINYYLRSETIEKRILESQNKIKSIKDDIFIL